MCCHQKTCEGVIGQCIPKEDINKDKEDEVTLDLIKKQAYDGITKHIERMEWLDFQLIVEALLTSMGHFVDFNAPEVKMEELILLHIKTH